MSRLIKTGSHKEDLYRRKTIKNLRIMEQLKNRRVADLVTENIRNAHVFKKYGIDFCCGGAVSIEKACEKKNISVEELESALLETARSGGRQFDYNRWDPDFLTDHIVNVHHSYVEQNIPMIIGYCEKVAKVHGDRHPEVLKIRSLFYQIAGELSSHLKKEELILFPFIKKAVQAEREGTLLQRPHFGTAENPVKMMEAEHESAGELFREIARLSDNYTPPEGACNTYKAMYAKLDEFEQDLHLHVHLENNILFPKALELEKKLVR